MEQRTLSPSRDSCAICGERFAPRDERTVDAVGNAVLRQCLDDIEEPTD
jgi:hypothetical protein